MKIIAFLNAYSQGKSGGDVFFIEVAKRLKSYDKVVVTSQLGKELCRKNGLEAEYLITTSESEFRGDISTYLRRMGRAFFLKIEIRERDILLGTSDFLPDVLPVFRLKMRSKKTKWVQHIFHLIPSGRLIPFLAQRMSFWLIKRLADVIIVDNNLLQAELVELGFDARKIFVNYPGIDLEYLNSVKSRVEVEGGYEGIFIARLHPSKGIFDLVKIWKLVCGEQPGARLGIIGKGDDKEVVRNLELSIKTKGLEENVGLLGYLEDDLAFATIKSSRIFIFPSREEGFGIAVLEAMACGLPVVAWDLPVYREIFKQGMARVPLGDHEGFAKAVVGFLTDEEKRARMGQEAHALAREFDWEKVAEKEWAIIRALGYDE